jgi:hypothetical protein
MDNFTSSSAAAYLIQAATELATEQGFKPTSPDEMKIWLDRNIEAIVERSRNLQQECYETYTRNREPIDKILGARMWGELQKRRIDRQVNRSIDKALQ